MISIYSREYRSKQGISNGGHLIWEVSNTCAGSVEGANAGYWGNPGVSNRKKQSLPSRTGEGKGRNQPICLMLQFTSYSQRETELYPNSS